MAIGMRTMAFTTLMAAAVASSAALTAYKTVDVEVSESSTYAIECMQGETFEWRFRHIQDGAPLDLTGAQTALLAWTAKGTNYAMEGSVYDATNGVARYVWASTNASPAGTYQYVASVSTGAVVLARARGTLTVLRGVTVGGEVPVWSGVTQDTLGASGAVWRAEWQGADDAVVDVATQALAVAQAALPQSATNGAEWGSHAGLATTGQVASAVGTATNLADVAATAALDSMMTTGRIYRAEAARMLESSNGRAWLEFGTNGAVYVVSVTNTTSVYVTETSGEGYNGPPVGTVFSKYLYDPEDETAWYSLPWKLYSDGQSGWSLEIPPSSYAVFDVTSQSMPASMFAPEGNGGVGTLTLDWVPATNVYIIATEPTVITISQNAVDEHDEDGDAHPTLARQSSLAGYVATNHTGNVSVSGTVAATAFSGDGSALTGLQKSYMYMGAWTNLAINIGVVTNYAASASYGWTVNTAAGVATNSTAGTYMVTAAFVPSGAAVIKTLTLQTNGVDTIIGTAEYGGDRGASATGILTLPAGTELRAYYGPNNGASSITKYSITAVQIQ